MNNLFTTLTKVSREEREKLMRQKAQLIWFTGLSGAGKSTLAIALEKNLFDRGFKTYLLDGDNVRQGLNKDLSFDDAARVENIRRVSEVAKLMIDSGVIVLSAFITPFHDDRERVKNLVGASNYIEVFAEAPLEVCEQRDVKGIYKKARKGEIKNFTGIDSPFEVPVNPDIVIPTSKLNIEESIEKLLRFIEPRITV